MFKQQHAAQRFDIGICAGSVFGIGIGIGTDADSRFGSPVVERGDGPL